MKKIYVVTIAKYDGNENYLDANTEVYAAESDAKERVDELTEKFSNQSGIDDSGELDGVHGSVFYFLDEHIVKVWYDEKEVKQKQTYLEKVQRMANNILNMGGTDIWFDAEQFVVALNDNFRYRMDSEHLWLYEIKPNHIVFRGKGNDKWQMRLGEFNETFLYSLFMSFKAQCERNLTDVGYKEVMQGVEL